MAGNTPAQYVFIIRDSSGNEYEFEKALNRGWERYENNVGRCRFTIPYNDVKLTTSSVPVGNFSRIFIYRNNTLVWNGFVAYVTDTKDGTDVYGLSWHEVFKWYGVGYNTTYTTQKIGSQIIEPIYDLQVAKADDIFSAFLTKGTIQNPYTTGSSSTEKTITRTVFNESFFQLLQDMVSASSADSPSGAWVQNTVWDISLSATAPTFSFMRDVGTDKSDVVFELDSEIVDFNFQVDLRSIHNDITGYAIQEGPKVITDNQADATSKTNFYRRELYPYFGTVTTSTELTEKTKNNLKVLKDTQRYINIKFAAGLTPFDGYVMGDSVKVRINRGRVSLDDFFRVVGMEVQIDNNGVETVTPLLQRKRT